MEYSEFLESIRADKNLIIVNDINDGIIVRSRYGSKKIIRLPTIATKNMAFMAGLLIGDGHLSGFRGGYMTYRIEIEITEIKYLKIFQKKMFQDFEFESEIKVRKRRSDRKETFKIKFYNKTIWELFNKTFEIPYGKKSETVKIPEIIKKNKNLHKDFIEGLFLADGGISNKSIIFTSISKELSEGVSEILRNKEIEVVLHRFLNKKFNRIFYESYIRGENVRKFKFLFPNTSIKFAGVG